MAQALGTKIFQQNITSANNGDIITPNRATELTFSIEGTATSVEVAFEGQSHEGGAFLPVYCTSEGATPTNAIQATTLNDALWTKKIISLYSFRVRIISISGGSVNIIGTTSEL